MPVDAPGELAVVAALFVAPGGPYYDLKGVDPWGPDRDARTYAGPHPVVAHPPCSRWCRLAGFVEGRYGHKRGQDGGMFAAALAAVRRWGGVLEHPAYSDAWAAFDLNPPPTGGGWVNADFAGGWACYVEQHRYGHPAKKATWLYAHSAELPLLRWGYLPNRAAAAVMSSLRSQSKQRRHKPEVSKRWRSATPLEFRDVLLDIARSARLTRGATTALPPDGQETR